MRMILRGGFLAAMLAFAMPAQAQQKIDVAPGAPYVHKPSGLTIPPRLDGLPRVQAAGLAADQLDDYVTFQSPDGDEITVYVYRHVTGDIPVWFDRTRAAIEGRAEIYGTLTALDRPIGFVPPGQKNATGMTRAYTTGKGPARSTAVAMIPLGPDWIVNIRYSSRTQDAESLAPRVTAVAAALGWPATIAPQPDSVPVADCAVPLAFKGKAKMVEPSGRDALMSSILEATAAEVAAKKAEEAPAGPPPVWCRDPVRIAGMDSSAVYRADGSTDSYLIAVGDAGRGIGVGPSAATTLLGKGKPSWSVSYVDVDRTLNFSAVDRLPSPDQAVAVVKQGHVLSSVTTWGDKRNININSDAIK